jgi:hypothetical protein
MSVGRTQRILFASGAQAPGASVNQDKVSLTGQRRVQGAYHQSPATAPAAGFPRVRQSADGVNWSIVNVLPQDPSQLPEVVFPFDIPIELPYVAIEWTNGGLATTLRAGAWAVPT